LKILSRRQLSKKSAINQQAFSVQYPTEMRSKDNSKQPRRTVIASQRVGANGSRECAPDDRLREAIHSQINSQDGNIFADRTGQVESA
jgi:hypothetical protein